MNGEIHVSRRTKLYGSSVGAVIDSFYFSEKNFSSEESPCVNKIAFFDFLSFRHLK